MTIEHTPLPWTLVDPTYRSGRVTIKSACKGFPEQHVAAALPIAGDLSEREANAAYIVRACNAFPDLVRELKAALDTMKSSDLVPLDRLLAEQIVRIEAVLTKAETTS